MAFVYNATTLGVDCMMRMAGVTTTVELNNHRAVNAVALGLGRRALLRGRRVHHRGRHDAGRHPPQPLHAGELHRGQCGHDHRGGVHGHRPGQRARSGAVVLLEEDGPGGANSTTATAPPSSPLWRGRASPCTPWGARRACRRTAARCSSTSPPTPLRSWGHWSDPFFFVVVAKDKTHHQCSIAPPPASRCIPPWSWGDQRSSRATATYCWACRRRRRMRRRPRRPVAAWSSGDAPWTNWQRTTTALCLAQDMAPFGRNGTQRSRAIGNRFPIAWDIGQRPDGGECLRGSSIHAGWVQPALRRGGQRSAGVSTPRRHRGAHVGVPHRRGAPGPRAGGRRGHAHHPRRSNIVPPVHRHAASGAPAPAGGGRRPDARRPERPGVSGGGRPVDRPGQCRFVHRRRHRRGHWHSYPATTGDGCRYDARGRPDPDRAEPPDARNDVVHHNDRCQSW